MSKKIFSKLNIFLDKITWDKTDNYKKEIIIWSKYNYITSYLNLNSTSSLTWMYSE